MERSETGSADTSRREVVRGIALTALAVAAGSGSASALATVGGDAARAVRVGLYDSDANAAFAAATPWGRYREGSLRGAEAMLADARLPFRSVCGERVVDGATRLAGLDVVVAPHVLCMSDREAAALDAFVVQGGLLIASGMTAGFHADGRTRSSMPLVSFPISAYGEPQDARGWMLDATGGFDHAAAFMPIDGVYFGGTPRDGAEMLLPVMPDIRWGPPEYLHVEPGDRVPSAAGLIVRRHGLGRSVHLPFLNEWQYRRDGCPENRALLASLVARHAWRRSV